MALSIVKENLNKTNTKSFDSNSNIPTTLTSDKLFHGGRKRLCSDSVIFNSPLIKKGKQLTKRLRSSAMSDINDTFCHKSGNGFSSHNAHNDIGCELLSTEARAENKLEIETLNNCNTPERQSLFNTPDSQNVFNSTNAKLFCSDSTTSTEWSHLEISLMPTKQDEKSHEAESDTCHTGGCGSVQHVPFENVPSAKDGILCDDKVDKASMQTLFAMDKTKMCEYSEKVKKSVSTDVVGYMKDDMQAALYLPEKKDIFLQSDINANNSSCVTYSDSVKIMVGSETFCIKSHDPLNIPFKVLVNNSCESQSFVKYESEAMTFEASLETPKTLIKNRIIIQVETSDPKLKMDEIHMALSDPKLKMDEMHMALSASCESDQHALNSSESMNVKTITKNSLIFCPSSIMAFKIKGIHPENKLFSIRYLDLSSVLSVSTEAMLFEVRQQGISSDGRGFYDRASHASCLIQVTSEDPEAKFEEIKEILRVVARDNSLISPPLFTENVPSVCDENVLHEIEDQPSVNNTLPDSHSSAKTQVMNGEVEADLVPRNIDSRCDNNLCTEFNSHLSHSDMQVDSLEYSQSNKSSKELTCGDETLNNIFPRKSKRILRRKKINFSEVSHPSAAYEMASTSQQPMEIGEGDAAYLDKVINVNQLDQDITGVPIVVLERLSKQQIKDYSGNR